MKITVIGLGKMGLPIAKNLSRAGYNVVGYNRSPERRELFVKAGGTCANSTAEAVSDADIIISMLSNDEAVSTVSAEMLPVLKRGSVHISMSTIAPKTADFLSVKCTEKEASFLSAPVLGRPPAAESGQLFILLSGDPKAKVKVGEIWNAVSQKIFDFGDHVGTAKTVKLMMNYMIFVVTSMLSEIMITAEKSGIDKSVFLDTMLSTVFGAPIFKNYGTLIINEKNNPDGFATQLASKDLRLMQETAALVNLKLPFAEIVQEHFQEIISNGGGNADVALLVSHLRKKLS
jgi:3-hydroxyisobutyrate dehydrogenase-like beta-hydroxyacid dehydrogenase